MRGGRLLICWVSVLSVWMFATSMAEDVLYVVAQPVRGDNEVHWVPTGSPESARVLVEGLRNTASVYQYEDELWWMPQTTELAEKADLVGQNMTAVPGISLKLTA